MASYRELPLAIQTNYAELLDQLRHARTASLGPDLQFRLKTVKGRAYWYGRSRTTTDGARLDRYLGPDTPELREVIRRDQAVAEGIDGRRRIVRATLAGGLTEPDPTTGSVLRALAAAGVFRLRGVVVGTVAFQMFGGGLGVVLPGAALRTGDLDIAQDFGISVSIDDALDQSMAGILRGVHPAFRPLPSLEGPTVAKAFALPSGYRVEFLTTNRGAERGSSRLATLKSDATPLPFLDFLLRDAIEAAALYDDGILVRVPQPARFAIHKLMIARRRRPGTGKSSKDAMQAETLIEILGKKDPFSLRDAYREARDRGPEWRRLLDEAVSLLPESPRSIVEEAQRR